METEGYPVNQICDRISKSSKGLGYGDRYVRKCLDDKYKNPIKLAEASAQKATVADQKFHDQELKKKDIKDYTVQDIKIANVTQLRKLCKTRMQKGDFWERLAKQNEDKAKDWERKAKEYEQQAMKNANAFLKGMEKLDGVDVDKMTDEELGKMLREQLKEFKQIATELRKKLK
jgi:hypothetical protein